MRRELFSYKIAGTLKPESTPSGNKTAPYLNLVFSLACFTALAASATFLLASATAQADPNAFNEKSISFIGLIATAFWARQAWSAVIRVEPESDSIFLRKHRSFGLTAGMVIAVLLVSAGGAGTYSGIRAAHKSRLNGLLDQISELGTRTAPAKQKFVQIAIRNVTNLSEYEQRCVDLEEAINEYEPALQQMGMVMGKVEQELQGDDPAALEIVTTMRGIVQKDLQSVRTYKTEIKYAKQLPALRASSRNGFYDTNIQPVLDEEQRIAKDEVEILKTAKARGVRLPQNIYSAVGIN